MSPENKKQSDLDQAPQPTTPEELKGFKDLIFAKVKTSGKSVKYKDSLTQVDKISAKWEPAANVQVHADIGGPHEPELVEILMNENLGRVNGIDTQIRKHYRYFPNAGISEYEEELVEYYNGKRLIGEEIQRAKEKLQEADDETLSEEARRMIEHARDFSNMYRGSAIPSMDKSNLAEVTTVLNQCGPSSEATVTIFG